MPNLRHYKQRLVLTDANEEPERRPRERGFHRGMHIEGDSALQAYVLGDSPLSPAPTFTIASNRYKEFEEATWEDYDPVLCLPIFNAFYVRPDAPITVEASDPDIGIQQPVSLVGFYAFTIGKGQWVVSDLVTANGKIAGMETIVRLDEDMAWNPADRRIGIAPFSICDAPTYLGKELPRSDCQKIARNLVSFLYSINSSTATFWKHLPPEPKNRAERRQRARSKEGAQYTVQWPSEISLKCIFDDLHVGKRLGPFVEGAIRTQLQHHKFSNVSYVRSSTRYRELERSLRSEQT